MYANDPEPFHSRERFSYFVDLWSAREDWLCVSGWENGGPVGSSPTGLGPAALNDQRLPMR